MPPEKLEAGSASDWLRRSRSDLALARAPLPPGVLYNELCFHAQQAVEKSIKAVLVHRGIEFRKVHHLDYLIGLIPGDIPVPPEAADAVGLTNYAVVSRYPGDYEDIMEEAYQEAVLIAQAIVAWAEDTILRGENTVYSGDRP